MDPGSQSAHETTCSVSAESKLVFSLVDWTVQVGLNEGAVGDLEATLATVPVIEMSAFCETEVGGCG